VPRGVLVSAQAITSTTRAVNHDLLSLTTSVNVIPASRRRTLHTHLEGADGRVDLDERDRYQ
jgi:hypothetical protein